MNKKFLIFTIIIIFGIGMILAYTELDILQEWKHHLELYKKYVPEYKDWIITTFNLYDDQIHLLESENQKLKNDNTKLKNDNTKLNNDILYESTKVSNLKSQINQLQYTVNSLKSNFDQVSSSADLKYTTLKTLYESQKSDLEYYSSKPITEITNQEVNWKLFDSKGNEYNWKMPIVTYEEYIQYEPIYKYLNLRTSSNDEIHSVMDFRPFVSSSFENIIDNIYNNANDDSDFIYEVWFIVSQLTTYSSDIEEDPRWAIETLTRGGGDCEDLTILIADMLKSSSHTKDWNMQLFYMDSDNLNNPKTVNHVLLFVDDGKYIYYIESTAKPSWKYYPDGVTGWAYDI